jgi:hypothetical protein
MHLLSQPQLTINTERLIGGKQRAALVDMSADYYRRQGERRSVLASAIMDLVEHSLDRYLRIRPRASSHAKLLGHCKTIEARGKHEHMASVGRDLQAWHHLESRSCRCIENILDSIRTVVVGDCDHLKAGLQAFINEGLGVEG